MKRNKQNDIKNNGITLCCEVNSTFENTVYSDFSIFRLFLVIITSLCSIFMFTSGIGIEANFLLLVLFEIIFTLGLCSFKSKKNLIKTAGILTILLSIGFIILNIKNIIYGFQFLINDYLTAVEASEVFSNLPTGRYDLCVNLALVLLIFLVTIGLCFCIFYRSSFLGVFFLTFPFFELIAYWGLVPNYFTFFIIVAVWFISMCMQNSSQIKVSFSKSAHYRLKDRSNVFYPSSKELIHAFGAEISVFTAIISCIIIVLVIFISLFFSERPDSVKSARKTIKNAIENFSVDDIPIYLDEISGDFSIFPDKKFGTNDGGKLGQDGEISFKGSKALKIELYGSDMPDSSIYLKGYVAGNYTNNSWKQFDEDIYSDDYKELFDNAKYGMQDYSSILASSYYKNTSSASFESYLRTMTIKNLNASKKYFYTPYWADYESIKKGKTYLDSYVLAKKKTYDVDYLNILMDQPPFMNISSLQYFIKSEEHREYREFVYENYTDFEAESVDEAYNKIRSYYLSMLDYYSNDVLYSGNIKVNDDYDCLEDGFLNIPNNFTNGESEFYTALEVATAIQEYFHNNFKYTLSPGKTPSGEDFVEYFIKEQKKGYCTYFASAGTMLMRAFGFPARYVEGFVVGKEEFKDGDECVSAVITDRNAHAWCEVFIDNIGWVAVEFTPGYDEGENPNFEEEHSQTTTTTTKVTTTTKATTTSDTKPTTSKTTTQNVIGPVATTSTTKASENSGETANYSRIFKVVTIVMIIVLVILLTLYIWNRIYTSKRTKFINSINNEDRSKAITAIFKRCILLFEFIGIVDNRFKSDIENCERIYEKIVSYGIEINKENYEFFTEVAVEADMSINPISPETYNLSKEIYESISLQIYKKLSFTKKFYAKYFKFLY